MPTPELRAIIANASATRKRHAKPEETGTLASVLASLCALLATSRALNSHKPHASPTLALRAPRALGGMRGARGCASSRERTGLPPRALAVANSSLRHAPGHDLDVGVQAVVLAPENACERSGERRVAGGSEPVCPTQPTPFLHQARSAAPCPPIPPRAPSAATLARRQHSQGSGCDPAARAARQGAQLRGRPVRAHAPGARLRARALPAPLAGGVDRLGHHHLAQAHHAARAAPGGREGGAPTATRAGGGGNEARARQKERDAGSFRVRRGSRATRWPPGVITTHPWPQTRQGVAPGHACARGATPGVELRGTRSALTKRQRTPSPWRPARGRRQAQRR